MLGGGCGDSCCGQGKKERSSEGTTFTYPRYIDILLVPLITYSTEIVSMCLLAKPVVTFHNERES